MNIKITLTFYLVFSLVLTNFSSIFLQAQLTDSVAPIFSTQCPILSLNTTDFYSFENLQGTKFCSSVDGNCQAGSFSNDLGDVLPVFCTGNSPYTGNTINQSVGFGKCYNQELGETVLCKVYEGFGTLDKTTNYKIDNCTITGNLVGSEGTKAYASTRINGKANQEYACNLDSTGYIPANNNCNTDFYKSDLFSPSDNLLRRDVAITDAFITDGFENGVFGTVYNQLDADKLGITKSYTDSNSCYRE